MWFSNCIIFLIWLCFIVYWLSSPLLCWCRCWCRPPPRLKDKHRGNLKENKTERKTQTPVMAETDTYAWLTHWCGPALMWLYSRGRYSNRQNRFYRIIKCIFWDISEGKDIWNWSRWLNKRRVTHVAPGAQVSVALVSSLEWKGRSLRLLLGACLCCSCGWSQGRSRPAPGFSQKLDCLLHRYTPPALYRPHPLLHAHNYSPIRREKRGIKSLKWLDAQTEMSGLDEMHV